MKNQREEISARLRALREDVGLDIAEIEKRTGIAAEDYLSYEQGSLDVPMGRISQLAACFGVDEAVLMTGGEAHARRCYITRKSKGTVFMRRSQYHYEALGVGFASKRMDPFIVTVTPDAPPPTLYTHAGQEFNYVLNGRLELRIGTQTVLLEAGDSIYFDAREPHAMRALDDLPVSFLAIVTS